MPLVIKLLTYLLNGGPVLGSKRQGLGEALNHRWHGRLLQMFEVRGIVTWVMNREMLIEEDSIEGRDEFHSHKVLAWSQVLGLVSVGRLFGGKWSQTSTVHPGSFFGRALCADNVSPWMNTITSHDQLKPIRNGENLVRNYNN